MPPASLTVVIALEGMREDLLIETPYLREVSSRAELLPFDPTLPHCAPDPPLFQFDPARSPFAAAAYLPDPLSLSPSAHLALRDALGRQSGASPAAIPFSLLPCFRPSPASPDPPLSDGAAISRAIAEIGPHTQLALVRLTELGQAARLHGPGSRAELQAALHLDRRVRLLAENLQSRGLRPHFQAFSRQAPLNVVRRVDLAARLADSGLRTPHQLAFLIEPALARFWFNSPHARTLVHQSLLSLNCGLWLPAPDSRSELFAALPGVAFSPDFLQSRDSPLKGIDSYHPSLAEAGFVLRWGHHFQPLHSDSAPPVGHLLHRLRPLLAPGDSVVCMPGQFESIRIIGAARNFDHDWTEVAAALSRELHLEGLEIEWVWRSLLERPDRTLEIYDMSRGVVLCGEADLLESVERFAPAEIPPASARRRLDNRLRRLSPNPLALARAGAAAADLRLLAWHAYDARPALRRRRWLQLAPAAGLSPSTVQSLAACYGRLLGLPAPSHQDVLNALHEAAPDSNVEWESPCP